MNQELPDVQTRHRKGRRTRDQIVTMHWIIEKAREFQKNIFTSVSLTTLKPLTAWITTNWKILKDMGLPDHLTFPLRNLYAGQKATFRTRMEQQTGSKLEKEYVRLYIVIMLF